MIDDFLAFFKSNNVAIKESKTLVTVSGGVDSVVLAHLFSNIGVDFGIAHCNFSLRGEESDGDELFVKALALKLKKPFFVKKFNTSELANEKGISIQMAARELRYNWFEEIRAKEQYDYIATAHHKGDVVETMIFNLAKGSGLEGLHGIKAVLGKIIRPLLFASRNKIELFAKNNGILWREDSSNSSIKYSRNKIRHEVIPILEEINPKAQDSIYKTSKRMSEVERFVKHSLSKLLPTVIRQEGENVIINIKLLLGTPGYEFVLSEILKSYSFNYDQTTAIIDSIGGLSGKLFYAGSHVVNVDRDILIISLINNNNNHSRFMNDETDLYQVGDLNISTKTISNEEYLIKPINNILAFDKSKLSFPLELRVWKQGDVFYPLGMRGKKKLSDYMIDAKIPVNLKRQTWVVVSDGEIAGILNQRLDDRFKIEKQTKTVFEIKCN